MSEPSDQQVYAFIEHVTYKPGWEFRIRNDLMDGWTLHARWLVDDRFGSHSTKLNMIRPVASYLLTGSDWKQNLAREIHDLIEDLEGHERLEWLKLDGCWFWHPHPNGKSMNHPYGPPFEAPEPASA
jgi:hypothetical protein